MRIRTLFPINLDLLASMGDRHQFRAKWHDYNNGVYFVTICTYEKRHFFGYINNSEFYPSYLGKIVDSCILRIPQIHPYAAVKNYVIMPNHVHLVLSVGAQYIAPAPTTNQHEPQSIAPAPNTNPVGAQYIAPTPTTNPHGTQSIPPAPTTNPVGAQYIAPTEKTANYGCLKGPKHGYPVTDNHFNSLLAVVVRTFKASVTRIARAQSDGYLIARSQSDGNLSARAQCIAPLPGNTPCLTARAQCIAPLQPGDTQCLPSAPSNLPIWQRNYHEHIIRSQQAYDNIMRYIDTNIDNWNMDCFAN